jgi:hypothetical protein
MATARRQVAAAHWLLARLDTVRLSFWPLAQSRPMVSRPRKSPAIIAKSKAAQARPA